MKGDVSINERSESLVLPKNLEVAGTFRIYACHNITLPDTLEIKKDAKIFSCNDIISLPKLLVIHGSFYLLQCDNLTTLPQALKVGDKLRLTSCNKINSLPTNLSFYDVGIRQCQGLTSFPSDWKIAMNLEVEDNHHLVSLPSTRLQVGGNLSFKGCSSLTSLPNWIAELGIQSGGTHIVNLEGTGLSQRVIQTILQLPAPGVQFHISQSARTPSWVFGSLDEALNFWGTIAQDPSWSEIHISLPNEGNRRHFVNYLSRLTATAEYQNANMRPILAKRVLHAFKSIQHDKEIAERAFDIIYVGMTTCDDRIIVALDEIELMIEIYQLEKNPNLSEKELKEAGKRFLLLEMVNQKASEFKNTLTYVDEVEVYLAFQIGLAKQLNLPVSTQNMIFRNFAQVTDEQIAKAGTDIEKAFSEEKLEQFLKTWSPWIRNQKRQHIPRYEDLTLNTDKTCLKNDICLITQNFPEKPALYNNRIYDYDSFIRWFIEKGYDPVTKDPIILENLRKIKFSA